MLNGITKINKKIGLFKNKYQIIDTTINIDEEKELRKKEHKIHLQKDSESEDEMFDIDDSDLMELELV